MYLPYGSKVIPHTFFMIFFHCEFCFLQIYRFIWVERFEKITLSCYRLPPATVALTEFSGTGYTREEQSHVYIQIIIILYNCIYTHMIHNNNHKSAVDNINSYQISQEWQEHPSKILCLNKSGLTRKRCALRRLEAQYGRCNKSLESTFYFQSPKRVGCGPM